MIMKVDTIHFKGNSIDGYSIFHLIRYLDCKGFTINTKIMYVDEND